MSKVCQFRQPTFPCWLRSCWERVFNIHGSAIATRRYYHLPYEQFVTKVTVCMLTKAKVESVVQGGTVVTFDFWLEKLSLLFSDTSYMIKLLQSFAGNSVQVHIFLFILNVQELISKWEFSSKQSVEQKSSFETSEYFFSGLKINEFRSNSSNSATFSCLNAVVSCSLSTAKNVNKESTVQ